MSQESNNLEPEMGKKSYQNVPFIEFKTNGNSPEENYKYLLSRGNFKIIPKINQLPNFCFFVGESDSNYDFLRLVNYQFTREEVDRLYAGIVCKDNMYSFQFYNSKWVNEVLIDGDFDIAEFKDGIKLSLFIELLKALHYSQIIRFNNLERLKNIQFGTELELFESNVEILKYGAKPNIEDLDNICIEINHYFRSKMRATYHEANNADIGEIIAKIKSTNLDNKVKDYFLLLANELDQCWQNQLVYAGIALCGKMMEVFLKELMKKLILKTPTMKIYNHKDKIYIDLNYNEDYIEVANIKISLN
jgi:hypothetical protein